MIRYVDTSAALKLLIEEPESAALALDLEKSAHRRDELVSSMLLFTELHCAAQRRSSLDPEAVNRILEGLGLVDLDRADLMRAGSSSWGLRSGDAIHLAVALRVEADELVAYDQELIAVSKRAGLAVAHPGIGEAATDGEQR